MSLADERAVATPSLRQSLVLVGLCGFAYLYVFPYQAPINNPNENVRYYMTVALVEDGTYAIDGIRRRWGWVDDAGVRDGHYYSVKAPGTSLLGVPAYAAYSLLQQWRDVPVDRTTGLWCVRIFASVLPTLLWLFFLHRFLGRATRSPLLRDATLVSLALGSLLYGYALTFVSHTLSAVCAMGALMVFSAPCERSSGGRILLGGLLAAGVTLFEYPGVIASFALALYGLARVGWRRAGWLAAGGALPTLAVMHFQWKAFGGPFTPGHRFLENEAYRALSEQGFFGATWFQSDAALGLALDPGYGLLPLTPLLLAAPMGAVLLWRQRPTRLAAGVSIALCALTYLAICSMNNWRGGWTVGPRYLALLVPFLAWWALAAMDRLHRRLPWLAEGAALGATAVALVVSGGPSAYYPHLPEDLTRPVRDLIVPLVAYDYAPFNAGGWLDLYGTASMLPLFAVGALALGWTAAQGLRQHSWGQRLATCSCAVLLAVALALPSVGSASGTDKARGYLGFITTHWQPPGHDRLARLKGLPEELRAPDWEQQVIALHQELGQDKELRKWRRARAGRRHP